jgi:hypothetical protein
MAIDYAIQFPCDVRRKMPDAQLLSMVKLRNRAEFAVEELRRRQPDLDRQAINAYELVMGVITPEGVSRQAGVPIGTVLASVAPLDALADGCRNCPASLTGAGFGCIGGVNYPLTKTTEEWLVSRLPDDVKSPSLSMLLSFIADVGFDGRPVDSQRARDDLYELKAPVVRKWGGWLSKTKITSSEILHMLAFQGSLPPEITITLTKLLRLDGEPAKSSDPHADDGGIRQFKAFMRAHVIAGRLKSTLFIDS